jgi:hypothetical protein
MNTHLRVMLLIDADNVSADVIEQAVQRTMDEYGAIHVRRAYCNAEMAVNRQGPVQAALGAADGEPLGRQEQHRHRARGRCDRPRDRRAARRGGAGVRPTPTSRRS